MHLKRHTRFNHGDAFGFRTIDFSTVLRLNSGNERQTFRSRTVPGKYRVRRDQIRQCDFAAAKKSRRVRSQIILDSRSFRESQNALDAGFNANSNCRSVLRESKNATHWYCTLVPIICTLHTPFPQNSCRTANHHLPVIEWHILKKRTRKYSLFQCSTKNQRRKRGSWRSLRLKCAIIFALSEIAPTNKRHDSAGLIVYSNDGALQIFGKRGRSGASMRALPVLQKTRVISIFLVLIIGKSLYFVQLSAKRIFRRSLQHRIQCRIDAIPLAFYGLKTDLPLHLLAYKIDCVGLRNRSE